VQKHRSDWGAVSKAVTVLCCPPSLNPIPWLREKERRNKTPGVLRLSIWSSKNELPRLNRTSGASRIVKKSRRLYRRRPARRTKHAIPNPHLRRMGYSQALTALSARMRSEGCKNQTTDVRLNTQARIQRTSLHYASIMRSFTMRHRREVHSR
jgi:hypothetical protein